MQNKKIKIHIWHTGLVLVDESVPFRNSTAIPWGIGRGRKHKIILPISSYLIEHPKGLVLVDTGWDKNVRKHPFRELGITTLVSSPALPYNWAVDEQLAKINLTPEDLDYVLLSHLDTDHVSGLHNVKNAKKIYTSKKELSTANGLLNARYISKMWKDTKIKGFDFENTGIGPFGKSWDMFGDGSLQIIAAPGHSTGHVMIRIKNENDHFVLLANDVGYDAKNLKDLLLPGILSNVAEEMTSLGWLKECSHDAKYERIIFNHDRAIKPGVITF